MRVLICGDRDWVDDEKIDKVLRELHGTEKVELVIEGGARGADSIGRQAATKMGIPVMEFPANWTFYKKAAGPIRNGWMLRFGQPELVLAFHPDIRNSKGTKDMCRQASKAGVEVRFFR